MREKKTCKRGLALLLTVMLMTALLPLAAMANSEGLTDQDQLATKDAEKFTRDEETGFFSKDESGEWLGIAASGHTFLAVKQGPWSLIWTPEELSSEEQAALWSAITTSSVQLSPGKKAYFVSGEGPFPVEENNAGTYYAAEVDGEVYLLSDAGKISHFYYGGFSFDDPTVTPDPETTLTPAPETTVTPDPETTVTPAPETTVTPDPETTVTPDPETTVTPDPETTVTPAPETTVTPDPETTATPGPETTVTPDPETTVTPDPETTVTPAPETTVTPDPETTVTPDPETTVTPAPETTVTPAPETTVTPDPETTATPDPAPTVTPSSKDSDPDPSVRPTPQPSTAPTVPPEVILTEEPVPEGSLPEGIIEEEKVPLASEPATLPEEEIGIIDEAIPLGNLPQTGSVAEAANPTVTVGILAVAFSLAAAGVYLSFGDKKEKEDG